MKELVHHLIEEGLTISSCESFTVGNFGAQVGSIPGASKTYKGTLVTYQTCIKTDVLKVDKELVERYGVVSHEVAYAMCKNGRELFNSDLCVSFTGNAGPEAMEDKPVGLVYLGINDRGTIHTYEYHLVGSRSSIQLQAIKKAIELLKK